jgi:nucleotide-binding universal stress UspA family protein
LSKESVEIAEAFEHTESSIAATMEKAVGILSETGVAPDAVDCEIVRDAPSRSAVIVQTAVEGKYGTVVLGRKGRSSVREFAIGRVSSQVLQIGEELGVWIVQ